MQLPTLSPRLSTPKIFNPEMDMHMNRRWLRLSLIVAFCLLNISFGLYGGAVPLVAGGAIGLCYVGALAVQAQPRACGRAVGEAQ